MSKEKFIDLEQLRVEIFKKKNRFINSLIIINNEKEGSYGRQRRNKIKVTF